MIYPDAIEEKLGFDVIRQKLHDYCRSNLGKALVNKIEFTTDATAVKTGLVQVNDFVALLKLGETPAIGHFQDISGHLQNCGIEGNWLEADVLYDILLNIASALAFVDFLTAAGTEHPSLAALVPEITNLKVLQKQLAKSVDKEGQMLETASKELRTIRQQMVSEEGRLRKVVTAIFKKAKADGYVPDGASISVRDGRMVIPVAATNKRQVPGFIHDESASGNIVFLEPTAILEANNKLRGLQLAESREIRKILTALTREVSHHVAELTLANSFLAKIDLLWAKARLAMALNAALPEITTKGITLKELCHPLLVLTVNKDKRNVVPHTIALSPDERIMLISGPNAGGKSVALKSFGLNQMMLQSGMLPCCHPDSRFMIFNDLFVDIGDEQSIDNDLSTYSSHLRNMSIMLRRATGKSLVLIDEFGSGTDPAFGGAIAEAVLEALTAKGCFGMITTHFSNLKIYAEKTPGIVNAAMVFDLDKLKPLYELEPGRPGSSFSLEVAAQSGLPREVIRKAKQAVGANQVDIERLLGKLENEQRKLEMQNKVLAKNKDDFAALKEEYQQLKQKLEEQKKEIINRAKEKAAGILAQTNKEIEKTIRHIKEHKAEKKETRKARKSLQDFSTKAGLKKKDVIPEKGNQTVNIADIQPGCQVRLDNGVLAEVIEVKGKKAKVFIGELQSVIPLTKVREITNKNLQRNVGKSGKASVARKLNTKMVNFSPVLDIRGMRAAEVLPVLQQFLDEAIMLNQTSLKIIHGRGNGVLRQLVRNELRQWPQLKDFTDEHADRGGDGVTLISLT